MYDDISTLVMRAEESEKQIKELVERIDKLLKRIDDLEKWKLEHSRSIYAHSY